MYASTETIQSTYGASHVIVRDVPAFDGRYFITFDHAKKIQTIAVRGTANKANAVADIDSIKVYAPTLGIFLHRGFKLAADALYADAAPFLQRDYKTRITGHSLGGAVAAVLMMELLHDGYLVDQVLTFGQPKITNADGGKSPWATGTNYLRVVDDQDVVAELPPSTIVYDFSGPYEHFGPEVTLNADHSYSTSPVHIGRDLLAGDLWKTIHPEDVQDHLIANYLLRIKTIKK